MLQNRRTHNCAIHPTTNDLVLYNGWSWTKLWSSRSRRNCWTRIYLRTFDWKNIWIAISISVITILPIVIITLVKNVKLDSRETSSVTNIKIKDIKQWTRTEVLKDYRHLFTHKIPGVGAYELEYDFKAIIDIFRDTEVNDVKLFDYLSDDELLDEIRTQEYKTGKQYYKGYLKSLGKTDKMLTEDLGKAFVKELKEGFDSVLENENINFELAEVQVIDVLTQDASDNEMQAKIIGNNTFEDKVHIVPSDIIASISYYLNLFDRIGSLDDIDHLGNRRLRLIGELLKNQFRIGLTKMEKNALLPT